MLACIVSALVVPRVRYVFLVRWLRVVSALVVCAKEGFKWNSFSVFVSDFVRRFRLFEVVRV